MKDKGVSRRDVIQQGIVAGVSATPAAKFLGLDKKVSKKPEGLLAVSSGNGIRTVAEAIERMRNGADTLDAAVSGVNIVEDDPNDMSVGYGGLPNEDGVVELDACVMHGPTARAGSVGSLRNIRYPSKVAQLVLERTDHIMLVADGALEFAKMHGFTEEDLLTGKARERWVRWKEQLSDSDDYLDPKDDQFIEDRPTGTITCLTLNERGEMSGTTTTSGLAFKIPGRVGDSPIIGAGLYVDNEVGACGSTGRGEANIIVVENMRRGMQPEDAIMDVIERVCHQTKETRLLHEPGKPNFQLQFYAIRKDGKHGGGAIYPSNYAVDDGSGAKHLPCQSQF
jgi:N4-(beta-N-acetylglucosaminyl)-L-asparaginase